MNEYVTICITRTSHPWNLQPMCVGEFIKFIERQCSSITLCHKNSKSGGHGKPIKPRRCEAFLFQEIVPNALWQTSNDVPTTNIACREVGTSDIEATTFSLFLSRQDRQVQERNNDYGCHNVQSIGTWIYSSLLLEAFRNSVSHMRTVLQEFTYYSRPLLDSISSQSRPCKTRRRVGWKNPQTRCRSQTSLLCSEPLPTLIETF